jgi:hypothetical protein
MPKLRIAIFAALPLGMLALAIAVGSTARSPLTARILQVTRDGGAISVSVQISNSTAYVYLPLPVKLESESDGGWQTCRDAAVSSNTSGNPNRCAANLSCVIKRVSPGSRLRLIMICRTSRSGLGSFPYRLKRRIFYADRVYSLNPLDPIPIPCAYAIVTTPAFTAP